jgi:hypothetical protein
VFLAVLLLRLAVTKCLAADRSGGLAFNPPGVEVGHRALPGVGGASSWFVRSPRFVGFAGATPDRIYVIHEVLSEEIVGADSERDTALAGAAWYNERRFHADQSEQTPNGSHRIALRLAQDPHFERCLLSLFQTGHARPLFEA